MNANDFSNLDAQSADSAFAQFSPEEHAECQAYLDSLPTPAHDNGPWPKPEFTRLACKNFGEALFDVPINFLDKH